MPTLARPEAKEKLVQAIKGMSPGDLLDFHNELFPQSPETGFDGEAGMAAVRRKITDYIDQGLEVEELLDLWNVAFPETRGVHYEDEDETIRYLEESASTHQSD